MQVFEQCIFCITTYWHFVNFNEVIMMCIMLNDFMINPFIISFNYMNLHSVIGVSKTVNKYWYMLTLWFFFIFSDIVTAYINLEKKPFILQFHCILYWNPKFGNEYIACCIIVMCRIRPSTRLLTALNQVQ